MSFKKFTRSKKIESHVSDRNVGNITNKKIKSAQKETKYGLEFDSRLELYMYEQLLEAGIKFKFKPVYVLQEGFRYRGDWVAPITLTTDFELEDYDIIIDPKGFANDTAPLKNKMLKDLLFKQGRQPRIIFPNSQVKCREIIFQIKNGFFIDPYDPKQKLSPNQIKERIKQLRKYFQFDGEKFNDVFAPEKGDIFLSDIKVMQKWDFELLLQKLSSKPL